jgi:uncharacterized protein (DUF433 family)
MATVDYAHIAFDAENVPIIAGTQTKVRMIVMDHLGQGWDAIEIQRQHPYLTLGQIHSALAYYYDHQAEMDAEIEKDVKDADRLMTEIENRQVPSALRAKIKATGQLS